MMDVRGSASARYRSRCDDECACLMIMHRNADFGLRMIGSRGHWVDCHRAANGTQPVTKGFIDNDDKQV